MEPVITLPKGKKAEAYESLLSQIQALISGESDLIANTSNVSAVLKDTLKYFWVGFYFVKGDELVLGPFQGPIACTRIKRGKGVCGTCWEQEKTIVVPDVDLFPGHITCNPLSKSELVVPVFKGKEVVAVIDIDSDQLNSFDDEDVNFIEKLASCLGQYF